MKETGPAPARPAPHGSNACSTARRCRWLLYRHATGETILANGRAAELFDVGGRAGRFNRLIGVETCREFSARLGEGGYVEDYELRITTAYGKLLPVALSGQIVTLAEERCACRSAAGWSR